MITLNLTARPQDLCLSKYLCVKPVNFKIKLLHKRKRAFFTWNLFSCKACCAGPDYIPRDPEPGPRHVRAEQQHLYVAGLGGRS